MKVLPILFACCSISAIKSAPLLRVDPVHAFRYPNLLSAILREIFSIRFQPHQAVCIDTNQNETADWYIVRYMRLTHFFFIPVQPFMKYGSEFYTLFTTQGTTDARLAYLWFFSISIPIICIRICYNCRFFQEQRFGEEFGLKCVWKVYDFN